MNLLQNVESAQLLQDLIEAHAEAHEGDISSIETTIDGWAKELDMAMEAKAEGCAHIIAEYEARAKARKEAAKNLAAKAKADEAKADRVRLWLLYGLTAANVAKIKAGIYEITVDKSSQGKLVLDCSEDSIPADYCRFVREINTSGLKLAIQQGDLVAQRFAHIAPPISTLRIK